MNKIKIPIIPTIETDDKYRTYFQVEVCRNCGVGLIDVYGHPKFCSGCGIDDPLKDAYVDKLMICPKCKKYHIKYYKFCPHCGNKNPYL